MGELDGLVAVVTGGSSGIGLATARLLRDRGARVAVLDLSSPPDEDALSFVVADVSDDASVRAAVASVAGDLGGIDIVVNNAGIGAQGTVEDNDDDEWRRVLEVNLLGMVRVSRAALPHLRRSAHAAVVNVCSVVATAGALDVSVVAGAVDGWLGPTAVSPGSRAPDLRASSSNCALGSGLRPSATTVMHSQGLPGAARSPTDCWHDNRATRSRRPDCVSYATADVVLAMAA